MNYQAAFPICHANIPKRGKSRTEAGKTGREDNGGGIDGGGRAPPRNQYVREARGRSGPGRECERDGRRLRPEGGSCERNSRWRGRRTSLEERLQTTPPFIIGTPGSAEAFPPPP
ncbi:Hypothetical protein NTJ_10814 [Nesidiocoris tenuis]|uniref:Uncharacterized protein n=1 Tax=Nesidiocoris tenuis TaxID=355587 RepID=A0ABN7B2F0_9HEMI|nr:Hypothetical protein NTJ_10814 [Nesidiocoris tenuis]